MNTIKSSMTTFALCLLFACGDGDELDATDRDQSADPATADEPATPECSPGTREVCIVVATAKPPRRCRCVED